MWSDNFVAKSCDLSAFKDLNCSSKIFDWLGAKRIKIDRFAFVKALSGKLMPKQSRGFSNLRWLEPGNVYQVCITKLLFSIGWIIICLKNISFNWTPCSIIISKSGKVIVNGQLFFFILKTCCTCCDSNAEMFFLFWKPMNFYVFNRLHSWCLLFGILRHESRVGSEEKPIKFLLIVE